MLIQDNANDYRDLQVAVKLLQSPSLTAKMFALVGKPADWIGGHVPKAWMKKIHAVVEAALHKAADGALWTMNNEPGATSSTGLHKMMVAATGAAGGYLGFATSLLEVPVTTTLMMRSIADIARSEGFDLGDLKTKFSCIEVFGLGGHTDKDSDAELGYYSSRATARTILGLLEKELVEAAVARQAAEEAMRHATHHFSPEQAAKWLATLIEAIANRFGVTVTEKLAVQATPILGAVTGASINMLFLDFYQDMARGHFVVKRLEKKYGEVAVKTAYEDLARA